MGRDEVDNAVPRRTPSGLHILREPKGKRKTTEHVLGLRDFRFKAHMLETDLQHTLCFSAETGGQIYYLS